MSPRSRKPWGELPPPDPHVWNTYPLGWSSAWLGFVDCLPVRRGVVSSATDPVCCCGAIGERGDEMRLKFLSGALLAALIAVLAISGTAVAGQPVGGCPNSYSLIRAHVDPVVDKNGDGWICTKQLAPGFNDIDNNSNH